MATLKQFASSPASRVAWAFVRGFWDGEYRDFVDGLMRETKVNLSPDYAKFWKDRMIEELG